MKAEDKIFELENKLYKLENTVNALAFFSIANMFITIIIYISLIAKGF